MNAKANELTDGEKRQVMPFCQAGERTRATSHGANTEQGGARVHAKEIKFVFANF
jgi:hypothetical protein